MPKIIALASLYQPLEFLENRINNLNQCDMDGVLVWWLDVSPDTIWQRVKNLVKTCQFKYKVSHNPRRQTLYWAWNWIIGQSRKDGIWPNYFCNTNVDDILHPDYFRLMSDYLHNHPDKKIVCCNWLNTNIKDQFKWPPKSDSLSEVNPKFTLGHFPLWRSELHDSVGMFDSRMVCIGDSDFWSRIREKHGADAIGKLDRTLGCYLSHSNNLYYKAKGPKGEAGEAYDRGLMAQRKSGKPKKVHNGRRKKKK